jgi:plasmid stabilization system protein ParE
MGLRLHPEAEREFDAAVSWYQDDYPGRGRRFFEAVHVGLRRIRAAPESFPTWRRRRDVRACVVDRFPYTLIFGASGAGWMVYAVAHDKRRPGYWRKRITRE